MSAIDWGIVGLYLVWIVWDGIRLSKDTGKLEGYFLASKSLPWWAVGLSVMATQLSAITMVSSTGQGYADGLDTRLCGRGHVLIRGQRAPIVGAVSMDMITVDVTSLGDVQPGDEVVLLGRQGAPILRAGGVFARYNR